MALKPPIPPIVSLRRYGDIISLLPLLRFLARQQNAPVKLVVHKSFASVLDGVSYVEPIIWDKDLDDPLAATKAHNAKNAQVRGKGIPVDHKQGDFAKRAWNLLGYEWNRHVPLVFDKRDERREKKLCKANFISAHFPKILLKLHSFSSPFADAEKFKDKVYKEFNDLTEIVELDTIKAERIYDLLGLMDKAACLITTDTSTYWLAKASKCPIVSLVNPLPFQSSPPNGNVLVRVPYNQWQAKWDSIARAVHSTLFEPEGDGIALVYNFYEATNNDTIMREKAAQETWPLLKARIIPFKPELRSSQSIGDKRGTPFLRDMIEHSFSSGNENIVAVINNDILVDKSLRDEVIKSCKEYGCYWSYRLDKPDGATDYGADFFAMTRKWWFMHRHQIPDLLHSYPWWDNILLRIMRWSGCLEQKRLHYHVPHPGVQTREMTPGWKHNDRLAQAWLQEHHELMAQPK